MDDGFAREGVLTRCNQTREATLNDVECNNARRAASMLAIEAERARAPALEEQSQAKMVAMRGRHADGAVVYADGSSDTLDRPAPQISAEPPANDLVISAPSLEVPELAVVPRPFRDETAQR